MAPPTVLRSPELEEAMKDMALCPFCGSRQGLEGMRFVHIEARMLGEKWYYVECWMCGGRAPSSHTPVDAVKRWNDRTAKEWTPLGDISVVLPAGQKFGYLVVQNDGKTATFIDYIEEEVSENKDGIAAQVDVNLGDFRISKNR